MEKRGFIRTLEAVIAIILIITVILFLKIRSIPPKEQIPENIEQAQEYILSEVSYNSTFRDCLLKGSTGTCRSEIGCRKQITDFIEKYKPINYDYACEVCETTLSCLNNNIPHDKSVYADSTFLGSEKSRVFRIYFWEK